MNDSITEAYKSIIFEAFKEVPTHLKSGKPNPNHPNFKNIESKVSKPEKQEKPAKTKDSDKVTIQHYFSAYDSVPDLDPHDVISNLSKKLGISHEDVEKGLDKHAKASGHRKGYQDSYFQMVKDFKAGHYD